VLNREAHKLLEELADATLDGKRKEHMDLLTTVPLLFIDDLGMRKLPLTAAEELLEIIMRRYERATTLLTSNCPVEEWGKLLSDGAGFSVPSSSRAGPWDACCRFWRAPRAPRIGCPIVDLIMPLINRVSRSHGVV
jgi:hypothetical protein